MKQGRAGRDVMESAKREPIAKAVSINHVTNIGLKQVYTKQPPGMYKTNGFMAPMAGSTSHPKGSQGKR